MSAAPKRRGSKRIGQSRKNERVTKSRKRKAEVTSDDETDRDHPQAIGGSPAVTIQEKGCSDGVNQPPVLDQRSSEFVSFYHLPHRDQKIQMEVSFQAGGSNHRRRASGNHNDAQLQLISEEDMDVPEIVNHGVEEDITAAAALLNLAQNHDIDDISDQDEYVDFSLANAMSTPHRSGLRVGSTYEPTAWDLSQDPENDVDNEFDISFAPEQSPDDEEPEIEAVEEPATQVTARATSHAPRGRGRPNRQSVDKPTYPEIILKVRKYDGAAVKSYNHTRVLKEAYPDYESMNGQLRTLLGITIDDEATANWRAWASQPYQSFEGPEDFAQLMHWVAKNEKTAKGIATIIIVSADLEKRAVEAISTKGKKTTSISLAGNRGDDEWFKRLLQEHMGVCQSCKPDEFCFPDASGSHDPMTQLTIRAWASALHHGAPGVSLKDPPKTAQFRRWWGPEVAIEGAANSRGTPPPPVVKRSTMATDQTNQIVAVATTVAAAIAAQLKPAVLPPPPPPVPQDPEISFSDGHLFSDITSFLEGLVSRDAALNSARVRPWLDYEEAFTNQGVINVEELRKWTAEDFTTHVHMPFGMARVFVDAVASEVKRVQKLKAVLMHAQELDRANHSASDE
ncbi:hypothetical protein BKA62DRAFT_770719 [Auriculariales sp. MPI-PUGE-AT-0066]|nr:hypothetical protein BKA62DRAFT_770719 [Auriculariales sp. MPI-PUGE-AT-0066]